ncbi:hypothetical protein GGS23DRAFT_235316 [Durotheca rogersii]|uniref:uncharacterized protein n=1 Tax=Durotheca rogersii TaxID=419775 RepID=UPI00221ECABF|nr:uncharacterized protein GGS23DRAFT_235316 [Durotheca rogersii]KAI5860397.1 hypothetical protein GGS23DRAFT_235316 [Durotheca rogersii]
MAIMIPEILCLICSFLDIKDVRRFRLCCRAFADAGACFVHNEVVFYLHPTDLEMLRTISLHPIASKNVLSLVYVGLTMERASEYSTADTRKMNLYEFCGHLAIVKTREAMARRQFGLPTTKIDLDQFVVPYKNYDATVAQQEKILQENADISCIEEAVSRFPSLEEVTMASGTWSRKGKRKTPFDSCMVIPGEFLLPEGCRQLDSLLSAVYKANIKLRKLTVGSFSWKFFQKPPAELSRALSPCSELTCLELCIDTASDLVGDPADGAEVTHCQRLMETGLLRDFIKSLHALQTLHVIFQWYSNENSYTPRLEEVIEPRHRWEHLDSLTLGNIKCERQDLMSLLRRHRSTLKELCLRDISLRSTSWQALLPKIRKWLVLDVACVCGELSGHGEGKPYEEYWDLSYPDERSNSALRYRVNDYLVNDTVKRCPLHERNIYSD